MEYKQRGNPKHLPRRGTKQLAFTVAEDESDVTLFCDTCNLKDKMIEANCFCPFCKRYMCVDCQHKHKTATSTAAHVILIGREMPTSKGSQTNRIEIDMCADHTYRMLEFFCPKHNSVFCVDCKTTKHKGCRDVVFIKQMAKGVKSSKELPKVLQNVRNTMIQFERLRTIKMSQKERLEDQMSNCMKNANTFKDKLNEILKTLDENMKGTIKKVFEAEMGEINEQRKKCDLNVSILQKQIKHLDGIKSSEEINGFVAILKAKQALTEVEIDLNYLTSYKHEMKYEFEHDQDLLKSFNEIQSLGKVKTSFARPTDSHKEEHIVMPDISKVKPNSKPKTDIGQDFVMCGEHDICSKEDIKQTCMVTGSLFLSDGRLVLCDNRNNNLKLFDLIIQLKDILKMPAAPYDLAALKNRQLVITVPDKRELHFVKIDPNPRIIRVVSTESGCHGICYHNDGLLITCYRKGMFGMVLMLDLDGKVLQRFERDVQGDTIFQGPVYITANPMEDRFYVTDKAANTVIGMTMGGKVIFRYYAADLEGPGSITMDNTGALFVCGRDSNNIQVITSGGKKLRTIGVDGGIQASSIEYRSSDGLFIVAKPNSVSVTSYKLI